MTTTTPIDYAPDIPEGIVNMDDTDYSPWGQYSQVDDLSQDEIKRFEGAACYIVNFTTDSSTRQTLSSAEDLVRELSRDVSPDSRHLVVLHGLPVQYIRALCDSWTVEVKLIEAIAKRTRFRAPKSKSGSRTLVYEYPELAQTAGFRPADSISGEQVGIASMPLDMLDDPPKCTISNALDEALLCRTTLWEGGKRNVLFLDRNLWHDPQSCLEKNSLGEGQSLETRIWNHIEAHGSSVSLADALRDISYQLWIQFFEALQPDLYTTPSEFADLFRKIQRCLESNLDTADGRDQSKWQVLLDRTERHRRLALDLNSLKRQEEASQSQGPLRLPLPEPTRDVVDKQAASQSDENQRGLDRVSYLGGVLLPISIVSGILSMGETYGPGGDMFYIFWAVAVPLTALTLLVIYADSIRREVVWVESTVQGSHGGHDSDGPDDHRPWKKLRRPHGVSTPNLEQGVPYSYTEPIAISERISMPLPDARVQPVPSEPVMMLQPRFGGDKSSKAWNKRELGWMGALKCAFQLSKVKKMDGLPSGVRT